MEVLSSRVLLQPTDFEKRFVSIPRPLVCTSTASGIAKRTGEWSSS